MSSRAVRQGGRSAFLTKLRRIDRAVSQALYRRTIGDRLAFQLEPLERRALLSGSVVINEIHYDPDVKTEQVDFVELTNAGDAPVDLSGAAFTSGIDFTFPAGTSLAPGGYLVVTQNLAQFKKKFGLDAFGQFTGKLSNDGETVTIKNAAGDTLDKVDYKLGFPWPTVGDAPGYSIELINPKLDNDVGGNWRSVAAAAGAPATLFDAGANWDYRKGTSEASSPTGAWHDASFVEDASWENGPTPIGYDSVLPMGTRLSDMQGNYSTFYLRKTFDVADPSAFGSLQMQTLYDDGLNIWINGQFAGSVNVSSQDLPFDGVASSAIEDGSYRPINIDPSLLRAGTNVIAVQLLNSSKGGSSDAFFDAKLVGGAGGAGVNPTPGRRNAAFAENAAPALRQVSNTPQVPASNTAVTITAKATDPDGVTSVSLSYQAVEPGQYIALEDAAYNDPANWTSVPMHDDGLNGDATAGDDVYTAILPPEVQVNRRLVRYRISASDSRGATITAPYADDPVPNFAYYVYDGVPSWTGAVQPGSAGANGTRVTYSSQTLTSVPVYQLITKKQDHDEAQYIPNSQSSAYQGDNYLWSGALVYDGVVYDHIHYRSRGGVWRYAMGKNMWKFDFNKGHEFQARDVYGNPYPVKWSKLNLGANIQQGDIGQRGEQGLFETLGFQLFNLAGVPGSYTTPVHFRIVEDGSPDGPTNSQYDDDFQGLYLAVEQDNGKFLDAHGLPDGNFYKMEGGSGPGGGSLNNQGPTQPSDNSDLVNFTNTLNSNPSDQWIRDNIDLDSYYSYHAIVEMIHHYDIGFGKNYFFYHNPDTNKWMQIPWDLDLTWYVNYEPGGGQNDPFTFILSRPAFRTAYRNRVRELRDLLYNSEQLGKLADAYAALVNPPGGKTIVEADRAMWDYNPILASGYVLSSKAGQGRFYQGGTTRSFAGMVSKLKSWASSRMSYIDSNVITSAEENAAPRRPTVSYAGDASFPLNRLTFTASDFAPGSAGSPFAAMEWRLADVSPVSGGPPNSEIDAVWESGEIATFNASVTVPPSVVVAGHTYRVRVRMKDAAGKWSHWSSPSAGVTEFTATPAFSAVAQALRVTELNYNPGVAAPGAAVSQDYEFIEFKNVGDQTLSLLGVKFAAGITFTFGDVSLAPGEVGVVVNNEAAFRALYGAKAKILGASGDSQTNFSNGGELVSLVDAEGLPVLSFTYDDAWYPQTDGEGSTLEVVNPPTPGDLNEAAAWRASDQDGGSPGSDGAEVRATGFAVSGTAWTPAFIDYANAQGLSTGGFAKVDAASIPWTNANRLRVTFSGGVVVEADDLSLFGPSGVGDGFAGFSYDPATFTATWTLEHPLLIGALGLHFAAGAVTTLSGAALPDTVFTALVVPGDVDQSGAVNASDLVRVRNRIGRSTANPGDAATGYSIFTDVNADGLLNASDLVLVRNRIGQTLPPTVRFEAFSDFRIAPKKRDDLLN